jgi:hypothetical protein
MQKTSTKLLVIVITTAVIITAATTSPLSILSSYADPDEKTKIWETKDGNFGALDDCSKVAEENNCKGDRVNKDAREFCAEISGVKCKQGHLH